MRELNAKEDETEKNSNFGAGHAYSRESVEYFLFLLGQEK
jgi:hypothetical protein